MGISILLGAIRDSYDRALLLTRDSDLVPAIQIVKQQTPNKEIVVVSPEWDPKPSDLIRAAGGRGQYRAIKSLHIERSLLPPEVSDPLGRIVATRPEVYDPPTDCSSGP